MDNCVNVRQKAKITGDNSQNYNLTDATDQLDR